MGDGALLFGRASKAQSLDQGYPRESVAELRTDPPNPASPRLRLAGVLQHLPVRPKTPLEISWPMQKDSKARNPKLSTPALSAAKRHRRSPPALAGSAPLLRCQGTKRPGGGHCPSRSPLPAELEVQPLRRWAGKEERALGTRQGLTGKLVPPLSCWDALQSSVQHRKRGLKEDVFSPNPPLNGSSAVK